MSTMIVLRLVHIGGGIFWVGALLFIAGFLLPALRDTGPAGGGVMRNLTEVRHLHIYLLTTSWLTILSGATLAWRDVGPLGMQWFERGPGVVYGACALLALVAVAIGLSVNAPTAKHLSALAASVQAAGGPPSPEQQAQLGRLQARLAGATRFAAVILVLAGADMAVARYVG